MEVISGLFGSPLCCRYWLDGWLALALALAIAIALALTPALALAITITITITIASPAGFTHGSHVERTRQNGEARCLARRGARREANVFSVRRSGPEQRGIKAADQACRLANSLLSFFLVQKKSLYLFAFQLRHQHKSVVSLSKETADSGPLTSASALASGANMDGRTQAHTASPHLPSVCVYADALHH